MTNNYVFENVSEDTHNKIKVFLKNKNLNLINRNKPIGTLDTYCIQDKDNITVSYYASRKLMLQSNPKSQAFHEITKELADTFKLDIKQITKHVTVDEHTIDKEGFIGFDESGAGECFGAMFLGYARVKKEDLAYIKNFLKKKDIKRLEKYQVMNLFNDLKGKFEHTVKKINAWELDEHNKNVLLDRGYKELLNSLGYDFSKQCVMVDDYSIGHDLIEKLNEIKETGGYVIVESKADENYAAVMLASLVARKARLEHMDKLKLEHMIINPDDGSKVTFESGSPSHPEVETYIKAYRKLNPYSDLPSFVRKKWKNIQRFEAKYPKAIPNNIFTCKYCNGRTNRLLLYVGKKGESSELFCSICCNFLTLTDFKAVLQNFSVVVDSSAILDRTISKDLNSTGYFKHCSIIIPSIVYEEIDRKPPDTKRGGLNELSYIKNSESSGVIELIYEDLEDYKDLSPDKKFLYVMRRRNACILTKDMNMARFAELGVLTFEIVQDKSKILGTS